MNSVFGRIKRAIEKELRILKKLESLCDEEKEAIKHLDAPRIQILSDARKECIEQLASYAVKRRTIEEELFLTEKEKIAGELSSLRLTDFLQRYGTPESQEQHMLLCLAEGFRSTLESTLKKSQELGKIAQYTKGMVDGSMSIIWSASEEKVKGYGRRGKESVAYHRKDKDLSTLKKV